MFRVMGDHLVKPLGELRIHGSGADKDACKPAGSGNGGDSGSLHFIVDLIPETCYRPVFDVWHRKLDLLGLKRIWLCGAHQFLKLQDHFGQQPTDLGADLGARKT